MCSKKITVFLLTLICVMVGIFFYQHAVQKRDRILVGDFLEVKNSVGVQISKLENLENRCRDVANELNDLISAAENSKTKGHANRAKTIKEDLESIDRQKLKVRESKEAVSSLKNDIYNLLSKCQVGRVSRENKDSISKLSILADNVKRDSNTIIRESDVMLDAICDRNIKKSE